MGFHLRFERHGPLLLAGLLLALSASSVAHAGACLEVTRDREIRCPYRPIPSGHDAVFVDGATGALMSVDLDELSAAPSLIFDPLAEFGWSPGATFFSPDREHAIVARSREGCTSGDCSFGRQTPWLAYRDGDQWVHLNLVGHGFGANSEIHGWSTWLHGGLALFNGLVRPDDAGWATRQEENTAQIYAVRFAIGREQSAEVEPFAVAAAWRPNCLTGRLSAMPGAAEGCIDGQRLSVVRRCYDEPDSPTTRAWWNTRKADGSGGPCISAGSASVPVLRTYVVELDRACVPKVPFENWVVAHAPDTGPFSLMMGQTPEWGEMLSSISPDGASLVLGRNTADSNGDPEDHCGGFRLNLLDPSNPMSGNANRNAHVCSLGSDLRCRAEPIRIATEYQPPENIALGEFTRVGGDEWLLFTVERGVFGQPRSTRIGALNLRLGTDANARVALPFGNPGLAFTALCAFRDGGAPDAGDAPDSGAVSRDGGAVGSDGGEPDSGITDSGVFDAGVTPGGGSGRPCGCGSAPATTWPLWVLSVLVWVSTTRTRKEERAVAVRRL